MQPTFFLPLYGEENPGTDNGTEHKETQMKKLLLILGLIAPGWRWLKTTTFTKSLLIRH